MLTHDSLISFARATMPIKLPSHPKLQGLSELHQAIRDTLAKGENVTLDMSDVAVLPIAYIQLVMCAAASARTRGVAAKIVNPSFPALFAFESIGVDPNGASIEIGYA